VICELFRGKG